MSHPGDAPLGVFDSGLGGLTVASALRRALPDEIRHLGNERERRARFAVAAGLSSLRNDDVGAAIDRVGGVASGLHLADQSRPRILDPVHERSRIAER